jgi:flagellar motor switch protein FliN
MPDNHRDGNSDEPIPSQCASAADVQTQRLVRQAEPFLDLTARPGSSGEELAAVAQPFQFEEFFQGARLPIESATADGSSICLDVELGRTQIEHGEVAKLAGGSLVSLNSLANEPVDIFAQGRLVARAEVVTVDEKPSLRIVEIV